MNGGGRLSQLSLPENSPALQLGMPAGEGGTVPFAVSFQGLRTSVCPLKCTGAEGRAGGGAQLGDCFPSTCKVLHNLQHNLNSAWWDMPAILVLGWGVEAEEDEKFKISLDYKMCSKSIWAG